MKIRRITPGTSAPTGRRLSTAAAEADHLLRTAVTAMVVFATLALAWSYVIAR